MGKKTARHRHFLREWRKFRGRTLEQAASAIGTTHATLSRVERGKMDYTQPLLEALADYYRCTPADLIMRDPSMPDPWSAIREVPDDEKPKIFNMIRAYLRTGTDG